MERGERGGRRAGSTTVHEAAFTPRFKRPAGRTSEVRATRQERRWGRQERRRVMSGSAFGQPDRPREGHRFQTWRSSTILR